MSIPVVILLTEAIVSCDSIFIRSSHEIESNSSSSFLYILQWRYIMFEH